PVKGVVVAFPRAMAARRLPFRAVRLRDSILPPVVPEDEPSAVKAVTGPAQDADAGSLNVVILVEHELVRPEPRVVCKRAVAVYLTAVVSRLRKERVRPVQAHDHVVVDHAVGPTLDVDRFGLTHLVEVAVIYLH